MSDTLEPIFLYGAGGHGRSVSEVVRRQGKYRVAVMLDDAAPLKGATPGAPVIGGREALAGLAAGGVRRGFVSIGNNAARELLTGLVEAAGLELVTLVDPAAVVAEGVPIGPGSVLMPQSVGAAGASIGRGVILNTASTVDHDCAVEDFAHLSAGVHLVGGCRIGARCMVGIGAVLGRQLTLGERVIVGAGSVVLADVAAGLVVAGVPARTLTSSP
jgi:sugar O-acyltransferase (sialic acid O-acetyltransferase NeuD family)